MTYTHHAFVKCDDCGERHSVGNQSDCIDILKEKILNLESDIKLVSEDCSRLRQELDEAAGQII